MLTGNKGSDTSRVVITSTLFYCLHHQEQDYPDAFTFKPARWRVGPPGAAPAESKMSILLARMIFLFDLRLSQSSRPEEGRPSWANGRKRKNEFHVLDSIVALHNGPMVEFKRRD